MSICFSCFRLRGGATQLSDPREKICQHWRHWLIYIYVYAPVTFASLRWTRVYVVRDQRIQTFYIINIFFIIVWTKERNNDCYDGSSMISWKSGQFSKLFTSDELVKMPALAVSKAARVSAFETCASEDNTSKLSSMPASQDIPTEMKRRQMSLRDMVMTPDRVPKFTIPPLATMTRTRYTALHNELQKSGEGSPKSCRRCTVACLGLPCRSRCTTHHPSETVSERGLWLDLANEDLSDPVTRAAMSIPHLQKITTPYGFLALGESPCVQRRESLFFEDEIAHSVTSRPPAARRIAIPRTQSLPLSDMGNVSRAARRTFRSLSCNSTASRNCDTDKPEAHPHGVQPDSEPGLPKPFPSSPPCRGRLKLLLKKRLAAVRTLKSSGRLDGQGDLNAGCRTLDKRRCSKST